MSNDWHIYKGILDRGTPSERPAPALVNAVTLPEPPPWRDFTQRQKHLARTYRPSEVEVDMINAALILRRPLLITGDPGTGKSTLAYSVAQELNLGPVVRWNINSRTQLRDGLYEYDAIGRLRELNIKRDAGKFSTSDEESAIGAYVRLGPLGTALIPGETPRALLVDEIDKGDVDLPNDMLHVLEEGEFEIPELQRIETRISLVEVRTSYPKQHENEKYKVPQGKVKATVFPFVVMTSNGERDFPPAFLRRCLRLDIKRPEKTELIRIAEAHVGSYAQPKKLQGVVDEFLKQQENGKLATDQLLNALYLIKDGRLPEAAELELIRKLFQRLDPA